MHYFYGAYSNSRNRHIGIHISRTVDASRLCEYACGLLRGLISSIDKPRYGYRLRDSLLGNVESHFPHLKGFWPVWMRRWFL